jgi:hypothetical protein
MDIKKKTAEHKLIIAQADKGKTLLTIHEQEYNKIINDFFQAKIPLPKHQMFIWPSLPMTLVCMPQIGKTVMFSESCSVVSVQLRRVVSAGTLKSMKIRLEPSTSLVDLDHLRLISH